MPTQAFFKIVLFLIITIFGPQFLAAIRLASNLPQDLIHSKRISMILILLICAPLLMYYHKLEFMYLDEKSKVNSKDKSNNDKWDKKKRVMSKGFIMEVVIFLFSSRLPKI